MDELVVNSVGREEAVKVIVHPIGSVGINERNVSGDMERKRSPRVSPGPAQIDRYRIRRWELRTEVESRK